MTNISRFLVGIYGKLIVVGIVNLLVNFGFPWMALLFQYFMTYF